MPPVACSSGVRKYKKEGRVLRAPVSPALVTCRMSNNVGRTCLAESTAVHATAELVVPRSMPTSRAPGSRGVRRPARGCSARASSADSRIARHAPQFKRADLGHVALERHRNACVLASPSSCSVTSSGPALRGRRPSPRSARRRGSLLRTVELRNRNSAGSPTTNPNSTVADRGGRCPPPSRTARRRAP